MNKVAVTGASGFIGAYLCRALVSQNFFVIMLYALILF